jgi:hypothetical protein
MNALAETFGRMKIGGPYPTTKKQTLRTKQNKPFTVNMKNKRTKTVKTKHFNKSLTKRRAKYEQTRKKAFKQRLAQMRQETLLEKKIKERNEAYKLMLPGRTRTEVKKATKMNTENV